MSEIELFRDARLREHADKIDQLQKLTGDHSSILATQQLQLEHVEQRLDREVGSLGKTVDDRIRDAERRLDERVAPLQKINEARDQFRVTIRNYVTVTLIGTLILTAAGLLALGIKKWIEAGGG